MDKYLKQEYINNEFIKQYLELFNKDGLRFMPSDLILTLFIIEILYDSKKISVRRAIGQFRGTPITILNILSTDEYHYVRSAVAHNLNTPIKTIKSLTLDENQHVKNTALKRLEISSHETQYKNTTKN